MSTELNDETAEEAVERFLTSPAGQALVQQQQMLQEMRAAAQQSAAAQEQANQIAREQLAIAQRQANLADERYDYWKENFLPLEQELIARGKAGIDTEEAAGLAEARTGAAYRAAGGAANRLLERMGIAPEDERYGPLLDDMQYAERAAIAGAKNTARDRAEEISQEMRLAVAGMGRGIPVESLRGFTESARTIAAAGDQQAGGAANVLQAQTGGINLGVRAAGTLGNYNAAQTQFAAERAFQQSSDATQREAMQWEMMGQVAGTGIGLAASTR